MSSADPGMPTGWAYAVDYEYTLAEWYTLIVSAVLPTYDLLICLDEEIRLVWSKPWSWGTIFFGLNRFGILVVAWGGLAPFMDLSMSLESCYGWSIFQVWAQPVQLILIECTLLVRIIAMYSNLKVTIPVIALFCASAVGSLAATGLTMAGASPGPALPPGLPCYVEGNFSFWWAAWFTPLITETTFFALTCAKTARLALFSEVRTPLIRVLFRDGTAYFAVIFVFMLANLLVYLLGPLPAQDFLSMPMISISSVMCARMFVHLRHVVFDNVDVPHTFWGRTTVLDGSMEMSSWASERREVLVESVISDA